MPGVSVLVFSMEALQRPFIGAVESSLLFSRQVLLPVGFFDFKRTEDTVSSVPSRESSLAMFQNPGCG
jgi:hypothetical protein